MPVITTIEDLRLLAKQRVPKMFYDYADSGSWTEQTYRENSSDFEKIRLRQRIAVDMEGRNLATKMVGEDVTMPVALAPTGLTGMQHADGEILAAKAAEAAVKPGGGSATASTPTRPAKLRPLPVSITPTGSRGVTSDSVKSSITMAAKQTPPWRSVSSIPEKSILRKQKVTNGPFMSIPWAMTRLLSFITPDVPLRVIDGIPLISNWQTPMTIISMAKNVDQITLCVARLATSAADTAAWPLEARLTSLMTLP